VAERSQGVDGLLDVGFKLAGGSADIVETPFGDQGSHLIQAALGKIQVQLRLAGSVTGEPDLGLFQAGLERIEGIAGQGALGCVGGGPGASKEQDDDCQ
jgi:hypothetical protein